MGSSMVGNPTCARTAPSTNSTNACTTDWGCTTTSTASYRRPNRRCASITSSALLTRVAESTVIFNKALEVIEAHFLFGLRYDAEQEVRLDHLERLVDEGGRVHRDPLPHLPRQQ